MSPRFAHPARRSALLALAAVVLLPAAAGGHAVVHPAVAPPGAYQKYVLRVPNERDVATTRVEIEFPTEVQVVSFADVPGWNLTVRTDRAERVVGAAWEGTLPVGRFVEFPFVAVNPDAETRLRWRANQTYEGGERVAWDGPEDSGTPASFTRVGAAVGSRPTGVSLALAGGALVLSLLSLGLVLRRRGGDEPGG